MPLPCNPCLPTEKPLRVVAAPHPRVHGDTEEDTTQGASHHAGHRIGVSGFPTRLAPLAAIAASLFCGCRGITARNPESTMNAARTGLVYSDAYLAHDPGRSHPENPDRLRTIVRALKEAGLWERLAMVPPRPADDAAIARVHDRRHIARVREACRNAPAELDGDTAVSAGSCDAAFLAAGGVMAAADAVVEGKVRNAFCAVRPPGHHATRDRAMGFCLFNNVAVAARHIQDRHGLRRILIVDWDAHHGNGTQDAFYGDPDVLYFSTHQFPCYPGSGSAGETGEGAGKGFTINVPMRAGSGDGEYLRAFREVLVPAADRFKPEFVLISAGFDAHEGDPITNLGVTTGGFAELTRIVKGIAEKHCGGRLVSVLEGGYDRGKLGDSVATHVGELLK